MNSQSLKMVFDNSIRPNPVCGVARQSRSIQERLRTLHGMRFHSYPKDHS